MFLLLGLGKEQVQNPKPNPMSISEAAFGHFWQVLSAIELWEQRGTDRYSPTIHAISKATDETVARLHLAGSGAKLVQLTPAQAAHLVVPQNGPFVPLRGRNFAG